MMSTSSPNNFTATTTPKLEPSIYALPESNGYGGAAVVSGGATIVNASINCSNANVGRNKRRREIVVKQEVARVPVEENYNDRINEDDIEFFNSLPPGYRFCPTDEELIEHYLFKKLKNVQLPRNQIREVNIYRFNPDEIAERYPSINKNAWYFFTPRDKKYLNGSRPNRAAGAGFWKACGADRVIRDKITPNIEIGLKKALVYHRGKPPKGQKTNWLMHEFMLHVRHPRLSEIKTSTPTDSMKLNDFVLCKIYKRNDSALKAEKAEVVHEEEGKGKAAVVEGEGNVIPEFAVKEELEFEGNVKVEEENNAAFHLENEQQQLYPPFNSAIEYPYEGYYPYNSQMPSTSYHQNQHYGYHPSGSGLNSSQIFMSCFDPAASMSMEDMDFFVEEFDDIITPTP